MAKHIDLDKVFFLISKNTVRCVESDDNIGQ